MFMSGSNDKGNRLPSRRGVNGSQTRGSGPFEMKYLGGLIVFMAGWAIGSLQTRLLSDSSGGDVFSDSFAGLGNDNSRSGASRGAHADGWHSIEVFYGKTDHLERTLPTDTTWFSQARQDEAVSTLLRQKKNGYFVDLAANDATTLSNTYSLEKNLGWTGLCIEPNPVYWSNLTYRDCQVVAAVVGNRRMEEMHFRFDAGDHSGIIGFDNGQHLRRKAKPVYTVTLTEILSKFGAPRTIDYLSLDVEGAELFIMENFPLKEYSISILTVERPKEPLRNLLENHGFQQLQRLTRWGETLWAHKDVIGTLDLTSIDQFKPPPKQKKPDSESVPSDGTDEQK